MQKITHKKRSRSPFQIHFNKLMTLLMASLIAVVIVSVAAYINHEFNHKLEQDEMIYTQDKYIIYQENFNSLINAFEDIIHSFDAYMKTSEQVLPEEGVEFFEIISMPEAQYIHEAQIVKGDTITFNFPYDASKVGTSVLEDQDHQSCVDLVKETGDLVLDGPISWNDIQVYVIHVPILDFTEERNYWGLGSIVIDAKTLNEQIDAFAKEAGLELLIYNEKESERPIIGEEAMLEAYPIVYKSTLAIGWTVYAANPNQVNSYRNTSLLILSSGLLLGITLALLYYRNKVNNYQLTLATTTDALSGLYNRRYLETVQQKITYDAIIHNKPYGLMHIDLDNFKCINDQFGHLLGDRVIVEMGSLLKESTRKNELVFRIGGDEFLMIVPELTSDEELHQLRKRLEVSIMTHFKEDKRFEHLGASVGVAIFNEDTNNFDEVLKLADFNMYEEKAKHKNSSSQEGV